MDVLIPIILANVDKGCTAEVGIGYSSMVFVRHSINLNVNHYSCDKKKSRCDWLEKYTKEQEKPCNNVNIYRGKSYAFAEWLPEPPAVVLLDGNHNLGVVETEISLFLPKLVVGGVIFLHDTCPWEATYKRKLETKGKRMTLHLIKDKLKANPELEVFTWPYTASYCGLTMILKKDMNQPWYRL
ncbi:MAG: class I SAM-dependent methyltransferase [Promethearchaeota archaeon]